VTVWEGGTERLREDPAFGPLIERVGPVALRPSRGTPFEALVATIIYQQLAGKAALTIHGRFVAALSGAVTPARVLAAAPDALRAAGLSGNKLAAIHDLARQTEAGELRLDGLHALPDEEVIARLVRVRGVGVWTAQMFLMFELRRPDVWPTGDLGVRNGLGRVLGLPAPPTPREMEWAGVGYRPWRSAVAWYCWRAVE
jgi:DNA-3-methyladenine glycosylase II